MSAEEYITELLEERDTLDPIRYGHAIRMINDEIQRVEDTEGRRLPVPQPREAPPPPREQRPPPAPIPAIENPPPPQHVYTEEVAEVTEKIVLPIKENPRFKFVGKLIGPGGSIIKGISEATRTRVMLQGQGSIKDKEKEAELLKSDDPKHAHLKEPLHVFIKVKAPKSEAHDRIADALKCIQNALFPTPDDTMYDPFVDMGIEAPPEGFRERGGEQISPTPRGGGRGRGRGARGRGGPASRPPPREEYPPRYEESGPSRYPEGRGGYRSGEKRAAPAGSGYTPKKYRDDPYAEDPYAY